MRRICAFVLFVWAVSFASTAAAQIGGAAITGIVVDAAGSPVAGAAVTITSVSTRSSRSAVTADGGGFFVGALRPGTYRVKIELSGFRSLLREGVNLSTGETVQLNLALEVGSVAESVTVEGDASLLRSAVSGLGHVVDNQKVVELPLNGRSFITLATLVPGVAVPPPPAAPFPRINGGRPRTNQYLFDGISVLQPEPGQVAFFPNVDAILEFKIESNSPAAEFGRFNGGVVNLTTKSGTNGFHGTLFEFLRHESLNARNLFQPTGPKPEFRRNQFGGVAGGPMKRDRTFFFGDYQGQRQTIARTVISTVPTVLQRQGIFIEAIAGRVPIIYDPETGTTTREQFPGNTIPVSRIDPVARTLLDRYPQPTTEGTANNYRRTGNETVDHDLASFRIDHRMADADHMFARLTRFSETFIPVTPLPEGSGVTSGTLGPQDTTSWSFASSYQRTMSSSLLNELRVGDTRRTVGRSAARLAGTPSSILGIPGIPTTAEFPDTLPTFLIAGYQQLGSPPNTASNFATSVTQIADSVTWLKGRHTVKMGADLRWERL
ncbi:MAG TPA: carboxypeptidase-like regulatory domain-containing protein, partial [Vicinamibacterales bacterium]